MIASSPTLTWTDQTVSFGDFNSQVEAGLIDLNPPHQRGVVHDNEWMSDVLHSAIYDNDIPEVYFHQRRRRGDEIRESLDGKQRCSAAVGYLNDEYAYTGPEPDEMTGRKFSDLPEALQNRLRHQCTLRLRIAQQTLTDEQIQRFFQKRQMAKKTTTGEHLNSCITSPLLKPFRELMAEDTVAARLRTLARTSKRESHLEMVTRIARCYQELDKPDCSPSVLINWFVADGVDGDLAEMCALIRVTLEMLVASQLKGRNSKPAYLSVAQYLASRCLDDGADLDQDGHMFNEDELEALRETISGGILDLSVDNGERGATPRAMANLAQYVDDFQEGSLEYVE